MFMYMYVHVNLTTRNGASYVGSPSSFLYISLYLRLRGRSRWTQHAANTVVQLGKCVVQKITGKESPTKPFGEFWWFVNVYLMVVCCSLPRYFTFQMSFLDVIRDTSYLEKGVLDLEGLWRAKVKTAMLTSTSRFGVVRATGSSSEGKYWRHAMIMESTLWRLQSHTIS